MARFRSFKRLLLPGGAARNPGLREVETSRPRHRIVMMRGQFGVSTTRFTGEAMKAAISLERNPLATKEGRANYDRLFDSLFPKVYAFAARRVSGRSRIERVVEDVFYDLAAAMARNPPREELLRLAFLLTKRRLHVEESLRANLKAS